MSYPRNSLCPCGSNKKYKKCCLSKDQDELSKKVLESRKLTPENLKKWCEDLMGNLFRVDEGCKE